MTIIGNVLPSSIAAIERLLTDKFDKIVWVTNWMNEHKFLSDILYKKSLHFSSSSSLNQLAVKQVIKTKLLQWTSTD